MPKLIWTCCFSTFEIFNTQTLWTLIQGWEQGQEIIISNLSSNLSITLDSILKFERWYLFMTLIESVSYIIKRAIDFIVFFVLIT